MTDLTARLEAATLSLAGPGPLKERFADAYAHLEDVRATELPELGNEFAEMITALHRERALPGDTVVRASVRKLSREEVRRYAELLVKLYGMVARLKHQRGVVRAVSPMPALLPASNGV